MPRHTVLLVDDHLVFTRDVVRLLSERFEIFGAITDVSAVVEIAATLRPDVIVLWQYQLFDMRDRSRLLDPNAPVEDVGAVGEGVKD